MVKSLEKMGEGAFSKWSPDGETISFTGEEECPADPLGITYDVYACRPDGTDVRCLTREEDALSGAGWKGQPFWHPSGKPPVFTAENARHPWAGTGVTARPGLGRNHDLCMTTREGDRFWRLTDCPEDGENRPGFSHDGKKLFWNEEFSMKKYPHGKPTDPD